MTQLSILNNNNICIPKIGDRHWYGGLSGLLSAIFIAELSKNNAKQLIVVALPDPSQVATLEQELLFLGVTPHVLSDWETLVYDRLSPHQDITSERLALLSNMPQKGVLLIASHTLAQRIAPPSWLLGQFFDLKVGDKFQLQQQKIRLVTAGYRLVDTVYEAGEFAVRGGLMDIFPMGQMLPIRIDLLDDDIHTLKQFDPESQKTIQPITQFQLLPAKEFPLTDAKSTFKARFAESFPQTSLANSTVYNDIHQGISPSGIEYFLPLFFEKEEFEQQGSLFKYLPENTVIVLHDTNEKHYAQFWQEVSLRYEDRRHNRDYPILSPEQLFLNQAELNEHTKKFPRIIINDDPFIANRAGVFNIESKAFPDLTINHKLPFPPEMIKNFVTHFDGRVLIVAETRGRQENLKELLIPAFGQLPFVASLDEFLAKTTLNIALTVAPLDKGLYTENLAIITENQLFGQRIIGTSKRRKTQSPTEADNIIKGLSELSIGSPVVHIDHGVGRYAGLVMLEAGGMEGEFLQIDYAGDGKVYVPVTHLHLVSRYANGDPDLAPLHQLGNERWSKEKTKALEKIHDVAAELLDIEARRNAKAGLSFEIDEVAYQQFCAGFPFEETLDQATAIMATLADMQSTRPMDRLVCGDVGFGKTEVAMRASFVAVHAGKQVAVLVPTTLLAQQHYENFCDRFADFPVKIAVLSRFGTGKAQQKTIEDIAEGKVDIVIGTHKLLQGDIQFKQLGLMIIDEEHRFGVRDKERIKAMRADVDMLTLTATPIPRTLNMAFSGIRDLSIISTPPARRLNVKTFVMERTDATLKEAILRELLRGGQVYFLHNEVDTIQHTADEISRLVPEARVAIAHGQMRERELERVTQQFYHKDCNVLVCTTIIETGIDVPNANTIIIERADKLGLAQLHQLRGRVGRSHHQAYAYMLVPSLKGLKGDSAKRLEAIERTSHLGAGFILATEDLEIRGAGEILGEEQSGNINRVGFSLYMTMLEKATKAIKQGKTPDLNAPLSLTSEISLNIPALIPDEYIHDVHQRLMFYKRISNADTKEALNELKIEMVDRFGQSPVQVGYLFRVHQIRLVAEKLGIKSIVLGAQGGTIEFNPDTPVEAITIIQILQKEPQRYRMEGGQRLKVLQVFEDSNHKLDLIESLLQRLS